MQYNTYHITFHNNYRSILIKLIYEILLYSICLVYINICVYTVTNYGIPYFLYTATAVFRV